MLFVARVAGNMKLRTESRRVLLVIKGDSKDKEPKMTPSYLPVRPELFFDSDFEGARATCLAQETSATA